MHEITTYQLFLIYEAVHMLKCITIFIIFYANLNGYKQVKSKRCYFS